MEFRRHVVDYICDLFMLLISCLICPCWTVFDFDCMFVVDVVVPVVCFAAFVCLFMFLVSIFLSCLPTQFQFCET